MRRNSRREGGQFRECLATYKYLDRCSSIIMATVQSRPVQIDALLSSVQGTAITTTTTVISYYQK